MTTPWLIFWKGYTMRFIANSSWKSWASLPFLFVGAIASSHAAAMQSTSADAPIAMNLTDHSSYSTEVPFVDLFKQSREWIPQEAGDSGPWNTGAALHKDANGWLLSLQPNQGAATLMADAIAGQYPGGLYTLLFEGKGTFKISFDGKIVQQTGPGRFLVNVTPSNAGVFLKITSIDPSDPMRNIRFVMPGHEATYQTQVWNPWFLDVIKPFRALRFMDWQRTNNSKLVHWSDRPTPAMQTQTTERGVAVEHMVDLCNKTQKDAWFCMPHLASDEYVMQFASYVRDNLDSNHKIHVEMSNEVWNSWFQQGSWCQQQGLAKGLSTNAFEAQLRFYSERAVQMFEIWKSVFGTQSGRLVRTLSGQAVSPWTGTTAMDWKNAYQKCDAYAIAPYFGGNLGDPSVAAQTAAMSVDQILDACQAQLPQLMMHVAANAANTQARNLRLLAYEGGQHLAGHTGAENNTVLTEKFLAANRHDRMRDIYLDYLQRWKNAGGGLFFHFNSTGTYSKWGSWGSLESLTADKQLSPKYHALTLFIEQQKTASALTLAGPAPGKAGVINAFTVSGSIPGEKIWLGVSLEAGNLPLPFCGGMASSLGLQGFALVAGQANSSGSWTWSPMVPSGIAGVPIHVQVAAPDSCKLSLASIATFLP